MSEASDTIDVEIDDRHHYGPGETITGRYDLSRLAGQGEIEAVEFSVAWETEGKGDEDLGVHHFERITAEDVGRIDPFLPRDFSVRLPRSPLSYEGFLIKVRWRVRVRAEFERGKPALGEAGFRLGDVAPFSEMNEAP